MAMSTAPAYAQEDGGVSIIRDTEIEAILRQDCDPIFAAAGLTPQNVQIHIVGDKELNAFSAAGQQVFLNTGLIIETKTPNQLIGVIAHETGHIAGGHIARSGEMGRSGIAPLILGMGLGVLAALAGAPDAAAGLIYSSSYFAQLSVLGYSRVQESAADQAAVTYLEKSGQSGEGLVEFFNNFRYQEVFSDEKKYPFFRDHPLSDDRIEALTARVSTQPHFHAVDSPEAIAKHEIMKAKLEAFLNGPQQTFVEYPETNTSFPARYARAIAYYKMLETDKALKQIDALIADQPNNPYLWELKGQVLFEAGRPKEAEPAHRRSVELKPDAPLLRINLGQTLVATEDKTKLDEAITEINRALTEEPDNALGWRLLSEAYDSKGEAGRARLAAAEQNFYLGQMKDARTFAMRARDLLKKDTPEWRRATDIVLASKPSPQELQELNRPG
ncbi:MAG: M48 family metallopeptidase [Proteobacteria bacterium]|nr:M48 family metallopeptidase [Pseudomonadota bacterium]